MHFMKIDVTCSKTRLPWCFMGTAAAVVLNTLCGYSGSARMTRRLR